MFRTTTAVLLIGVALGCGGDPAAPSAVVGAVRGDPAAPVILEGPDGSFGRAVAAARGVVAVVATAPVPGKAYVFEQRATRWVLAATLSAPGRTEGDWAGWFGRGLALERDRLVVGAPWAPGGGRVYVFHRGEVGWELEAEFTPSIPTASAFGRAVALERDTLLVGAPEGADGGSVFVFERRGSTWLEVGRLAPEEPLGYDEFGFSIALSGEVAVVGAPRTSLGPWATEWDTAGVTYVFARTAGGWRQETVLAEPALEYNGNFGLSVAAAPGVIVISCGCPDGDAYVYERVDGGWAHVATLQPGWATEWTLFGHEVAVSNGHAFVSAPFGEPSGTVLRWERTAGGWVADGELTVGSPVPGLQVGHAIAASGELVVVGVPRQSEETGIATIFPAGAR